MIAVIQRVSEASVTINGIVKSSIHHGVLVLLGFECLTDNDEDIAWLSQQNCVNLRIFQRR